MKSVTKYQCEVCNNWHENQEDALRCEQDHLKINKTETEYRYSKHSDTPFEIILVFGDPSSARFDRKVRRVYRREDESQH